MKILHVCSYYIGSKIYKHLIKSLDEIYVSNDVFIPIHSDKLINKNYQDNLKQSKLIYSKNFNKFDRLNFKFKNYKIYQDLLKKVNLDNIDIVHAHSLFVNGYIAYKLKIDKNIDYIVAVRSTDIGVFFKYMIHLRKLGIEILKNSKKIILISPSYRDKLISNYIPEDIREEIEQKIEVIPNGVDNFWIENTNMISKKINNKSVKLLYVGQLTKNKNIYSIIDATKILKNKGYNIELNIIGDGKEYNKIKFISDGEFKDTIHLHKYMYKTELINMYRSSDIFVMPSRRETFGLVYVEAISQGVPVIYTKKEGFDGYFDDGVVGYSVVKDSTDDLVDKIEKIIYRSTFEFNQLEEDLKKEFDWRNIAHKYNELYNCNT